MNSFVFKIKDAIINENFDNRINLEIKSGEHWFLSSNNGTDISSLFDWLSGKRNFAFGQITLTKTDEQLQGHYYAMKDVELVRFRISENETSKYYYQQRYHATENEYVITLRDYFDSTNNFDESLVEEFGLTTLLGEAINMLSTGEFKKACIVKASMRKPLIMFIEEPYSGIDDLGRQKIDKLLQALSTSGVCIIIAASVKNIPEFISHFFDFENCSHFSNTLDFSAVLPKTIEISTDYLTFPIPAEDEYNYAFRICNATVKYDSHYVLKNLSWTVKKNEKWALTGRNGSGKSTLLSLVYADNPQVYSNEVYVFDKKRGTGESIWEIKEKIGYYSTELYRFFNKALTVEEALFTAASANPYKKRELPENQIRFKKDLIHWFGLEQSTDRPLYELSSARQKLVLIISALIKNPLMLILDEPFQGFDNELVVKCKKLINRFCQNRTLVFVSHVSDEFPDCIEHKFELQ